MVRHLPNLSRQMETEIIIGDSLLPPVTILFNSCRMTSRDWWPRSRRRRGSAARSGNCQWTTPRTGQTSVSIPIQASDQTTCWIFSTLLMYNDNCRARWARHVRRRVLQRPEDPHQQRAPLLPDQAERVDTGKLESDKIWFTTIYENYSSLPCLNSSSMELW